MATFPQQALYQCLVLLTEFTTWDVSYPPLQQHSDCPGHLAVCQPLNADRQDASSS
jgi:hypothetical protein